MIFIHYIEICLLHRQDIHHLAGERSEAGVQAESGRVGGEEGVGRAQQQGRRPRRQGADTYSVVALFVHNDFKRPVTPLTVRPYKSSKLLYPPQDGISRKTKRTAGMYLCQSCGLSKVNFERTERIDLIQRSTMPFEA